MGKEKKREDDRKPLFLGEMRSQGVQNVSEGRTKEKTAVVRRGRTSKMLNVVSRESGGKKQSNPSTNTKQL